MAIFRKVHTSFWSDSFVSDLDTDHRYFYLYLLTNEHTKQCGIYEITKKQMAFETGYSIDRVCKILGYFIKSGKVRYNELTKELALGNWLKYNGSDSPKIKSCIDTEFSYCKDTVLIEYVRSMDTSSQEEKEEEEEKEQEPKIEFDIFWGKYPTKVGKEKSRVKWNRLPLKTQQVILDHLDWWVNYKPFPTYSHPNPETYFNQKRWLDPKPEHLQPSQQEDFLQP